MMSCASKAARHRWETREQTKVWYPKASDLALPYVPAKERSRIRKRISPWLANLHHPSSTPRLGVRAGWCWEIAQGLTLTAQADDVRYVEGVWTQLQPFENAISPVPHAWVTIEGYRVDLVGEFFAWRFEYDNRFLYEPLKEYSYQVLSKLFDPNEGIFTDSCEISSFLWLASGGRETLPDHLKIENEPQLMTQATPPTNEYPNGLWGTPAEHEASDKFEAAFNEYIDGVVFKPAVDRLKARYKTQANPTEQAEGRAA